MNILRKLKKQSVCKAGIIWIKGQKDKSLKSLFVQALKEKKYGDINWGISRLLKKDDKTRYAIFAAKQVLSIFEKEYPKDKRPRLAIRAAENCIKNPLNENKKAAYSAANSAANSAADAAYSAAADAAYSAANSAANSAADAAYSAANSAANSAADAAYSAGYSTAFAAYSAGYSTAFAAADLAYSAAYSAYLACSASEKMQIKILKYGYRLLIKGLK